MLNEPAAMVSEIICHVLMAFRNESSFAVFFEKRFVSVPLTVQRNAIKDGEVEK